MKITRAEWTRHHREFGKPLTGRPVLLVVFLGIAITPPGPTFRDVAELERLAEPTGIRGVEDGLYIVRYMVNASVWTVGFLFLSLVEYVVRSTWNALPAVREAIP